MTAESTRCHWCGKQRKVFSDWEQQDIATHEWKPVCNPCATRKLRKAATPLGAIIPLRRKGQQ